MPTWTFDKDVYFQDLKQLLIQSGRAMELAFDEYDRSLTGPRSDAGPGCFTGTLTDTLKILNKSKTIHVGHDLKISLLGVLRRHQCKTTARGPP